MWNRLRMKQNSENSAELEETQRELWKAHREWELAQRRLDDALGEDEVDYAVFMLEAAEKRYDILLRKTKQLHVEAAEEVTVAEKVKRRGSILAIWKEGKGWNKDG